MRELKPCPFCGGPAELRGFKAPEFWVACSAIGCKANTEGFGDRERAIAAWNTRAQEARIAQLEGGAAFLIARLDEFENVVPDGEAADEFFGHVAPAIARLRAALQNTEAQDG